jgi:hypothetical protein
MATMSTTTSNTGNMTDNCIKLMESYDGWFPSTNNHSRQNVRMSKPISMFADRKLGVTLLAQYGQFRKINRSEDWVGVNMFGGNLREGLKKLASKEGVGDSLKSDKAEDNLIFQFVKSKLISGW